MLLSQTCKYAIRAALHLAQHDATPLLSRDIARALDVPEHFLAKVLQDLARARLLHSTKGRGGGFRLAQPASDIKLLEIVQAIEGPYFGDGCVLGLPECSNENACPLHYQWVEVKTSILQLLAQKSLGELVAEQSPTQRKK